jgi:Protein of unknown function (DUF4007)
MYFRDLIWFMMKWSMYKSILCIFIFLPGKIFLVTFIENKNYYIEGCRVIFVIKLVNNILINPESPHKFLLNLIKFIKMVFSGHDTFHCRLFWLKKGFDYIQTGSKFKEDSGVEMGVGRNMVNSIRFWLKSFGVIDDKQEISPLYRALLKTNGWDPYIENEGTLLLLHYQLCANKKSSIYNLLFKELRKIKPEFSRDNFVKYVKDIDSSQNEKLLEKDFSVFLRMYGSNNEKNTDDGYRGLLTELDFLNEIGENQSKTKLYRLENKSQKDIPEAILLYCIISNSDYGSSISFNSLYNNDRGVGNIFCLDQDVLESKLVAIAANYKNITYNSEAGIKELQIKSKIRPIDILKKYYA